MKMTPEDFAVLKEKIEATLAAEPMGLTAEAHRAEYQRTGLSHRRYRWDILWLSKSTTFVCNTLYRYLSDDHIDTALKRILGDGYSA